MQNKLESRILQISDDISNMVKAKTYTGMAKIMIIQGRNGISKTTSIDDILSSLNLKYAFLGGNLKKVSDMYKMLYANNDRDVIVFDDSEFPIKKNSPFLGMLKTALDRKGVRKIVYIDDRDKQIRSTNNPRGKYPQSFELNSMLIFITNLSLTKIDSNLLDRAIVVVLDGSNDEIFYLIEMGFSRFNKEVPLNFKQDALNFVKKKFSSYKKLSFRIYEDVLFTRLFNPDDWENRALIKIKDKINLI